MDVDGSCHCGYVKFECSVDPDQVFICHCTDCQQISGSAFRMNAPAAARSLKILSGEPTVYNCGQEVNGDAAALWLARRSGRVDNGRGKTSRLNLCVSPAPGTISGSRRDRSR